MSKAQDLITANTKLVADNLKLQQAVMDVQDTLAAVWIWLVVQDLKGEVTLPDQLVRRVDDQLTAMIARKEPAPELEVVT